MNTDTISDSVSHTKFPARLAVVGWAVALALGAPATALAAPIDNTWDIEEYDDCMQNTTKPSVQCCIDSGGVPTLPADPHGCTAPPAEVQVAPQGPRTVPPRIIDDAPEVQLDPGQAPPEVVGPTVPIGPATG
ncbi:hypothetical protein [Mycolicibacterium sp.]|uniref:hypothetical protein n=1 Tax=Mycolicibacterium sp. TaxID=2320850 RepID=UPI00355DFD3A